MKKSCKFLICRNSRIPDNLTMGLSAEQIVKILQIRNFDRKSAFLICDILKDETISTDHELKDSILHCSGKKNPKLPSFTGDDLNRAIKTGNNICQMSENSGIKILSFYNDDFPKSLKTIDDCPIVLNFKGNYKLLNELTGVAIIGTRNPDWRGTKCGKYFGSFFAKKGLNIVSGLAKGCDTAAHRGCLKSKGFTTAVVAHGLHTIYPEKNRKLADHIIESGGLLVSEYFLGTAALPGHFIERDRIQAGISKAVIVIQCEASGSTMFTVNYALKYGRMIAAVKYGRARVSDVISGNEMLIGDKTAFPLDRKNEEEFLNKIIL
jgi:DNA processing protein